MVTAYALRAAANDARAMALELAAAVSRGVAGGDDLRQRAESAFCAFESAICAQAEAEAGARTKCASDEWEPVRREASKAWQAMQYDDDTRAMTDAYERASWAAGAALGMIQSGATRARMGRRAMRRMGVAMTAAPATGRTAADGGE